MNTINTMAAASFITVLLIAAPVFAESNSAMSALIGSVDLSSTLESIPPVSAPESAGVAAEKGAQSWTGAVKKAYRQHLETGKLFTLPVVKKSQLPPAALRQLNKDNHGQNPRVSTAHLLMVKNQQAFVIHNRRDGRSMIAHIFDAYGRLIALGKAGTATPLYWVTFSSPDYDSSGSDSGGSGYPGYGGGPDDVNDDMGGQGSGGGGPDDTDWDGCGSPGSGGGGGPDDTGSGF